MRNIVFGNPHIHLIRTQTGSSRSLWPTYQCRTKKWGNKTGNETRKRKGTPNGQVEKRD